MRIHSTPLVAAAAAIICLTNTSAKASTKLKVVTTTTDLKSIVEAVAGDKVEVASLGTGREDPHFIDAKPSYMLEAGQADLWVRIGLELEIGYENLVIDGSRNPRIRIGSPGHLDASDGVLRLEVPKGKIDRSMGDVHPQGNPHYWLDPLNARIIAKNVANRLSTLDSEDAPYFADRLKAFQTELDTAMFGRNLVAEADGAKLWAMLLKGELDNFAKQHAGDSAGGWWGAMKPLAGTKIITYHRSWSYFANRFGLDVIDQLEPKPGIEPSPAHLSEVIEKIRKEDARILLVEPFYSRQAPDFVADKTGIKVVVAAASVGGQLEAADYVHMMDNLIRQCVAAAHAPTTLKTKE